MIGWEAKLADVCWSGQDSKLCCVVGVGGGVASRRPGAGSRPADVTAANAVLGGVFDFLMPRPGPGIGTSQAAHAPTCMLQPTAMHS